MLVADVSFLWTYARSSLSSRASVLLNMKLPVSLSNLQISYVCLWSGREKKKNRGRTEEKKRNRVDVVMNEIEKIPLFSLWVCQSLYQISRDLKPWEWLLYLLQCNVTKVESRPPIWSLPSLSCAAGKKCSCSSSSNWRTMNRHFCSLQQSARSRNNMIGIKNKCSQ